MRDNRRRLIIETICNQCSVKFWGRISRGKLQEFCSKSCSSASRIGRSNPNWRGGSSEDAYAYKLKSIAKYPEKHKARVQAEEALRQGTIIKQPCKICSDPKSEMHHRDYSKPLEVDWLCRKHHIDADKMLRQ